MTKMFDAKDLLLIGTYGYVKAVDKRTGEDRWETSLPATGYEIVSVLCEGQWIFAGSKGYVFALDARTGDILWTNSLSGLGHGDMCLALQMGSSEPPPMPRREGEDAADTEVETETERP